MREWLKYKFMENCENCKNLEDRIKELEEEKEMLRDALDDIEYEVNNILKNIS